MLDKLLKTRAWKLDLVLLNHSMFGRSDTVIVIFLSASVLALFVLTLTSWFLGNRRQRL